MTAAAYYRHRGATAADTASLEEPRLKGMSDEEDLDFYGPFDPNTIGFVFPPKRLPVVLLETTAAVGLWVGAILLLRPGRLLPYFGCVWQPPGVVLRASRPCRL